MATDTLAIEHNHGVIDLLEAIFVAKRRKPAIDRAPWRQFAREQTPRAARSHHIEDAVDDPRIGQARDRPVLFAAGR